MSYKLKEYAKAFSDLMVSPKIKDKSLIDNFVKLIYKNGELKNASKIIKLVEKYYLEKKGNKKIVLEIARQLDSKVFLKNFKKEGDIVEEKINPNLVAGVKIVINESEQLDFSLQNR